MDIEYLMDIGFKIANKSIILNSLRYDLGRGRHLSIGNFATPNETMFITQSDLYNDKKITDLVCIHNYDYDGYLTESKLKLIMEYFSQKLLHTTAQLRQPQKQPAIALADLLSILNKHLQGRVVRDIFNDIPQQLAGA